MKKNKLDLLNRRLFVQMCIEQPEDGARYLNKIARKIKNSKKSSKTIEILTSILFVTEKTIYSDLEQI